MAHDSDGKVDFQPQPLRDKKRLLNVSNSRAKAA